MPFVRLPLTPGMTVGLYGGSFDPPHAGHLALARAGLARLRLDRVVWLVTPGNPLKGGPAPLSRRLAAVAALASQPRMIVSDIEARLGLIYSIDTIAALQARHPGVKFIWLMGADAFAGLHRWKSWQAITRRLPIAVFARPGYGAAALSSTAARRLARARTSPARIAHLTGPAFVFIPGELNPSASSQLRGSDRREIVL